VQQNNAALATELGNDLDELFAKLESGEQRRGDGSDLANGGPEDSFDENAHQEILDKMSLMDRDRYIELLRQNHRVSKMRTELFLADQNDDDTDMEKSKAACEGINAKHKFILTEADVGG